MFDLEYKSSNEFIPLVVAVKAKLDMKADEAELEVTNENVDELSGTVATQGEAIAENAAAIAEETSAREAAVEELNEKIDEIPKFKFEVVDVLPETGDPATIYLVKDTEEEGNVYKEYIYSNGKWEEIGPLIDLSPYATKEEVEAAVQALQEVDAELDEKIAAEIAAREEAISIEAAAREEAVANEASAREAADADLNTAIANEASARESADTELNEAIANEASAREAAVAELNSAIANEVSAREEAISNVNAALELKADADNVYTKDEADAKFLTEHQDISNLATKDELNTKADADDVYTKAEADAKFLTEHQDISSLATKDEVAVVASGLASEVSAREQAIEELHEEIVALPKFKIVIVNELPVSGDNATIYLVPTGSESGNIYTEYVYVNDTWEEVGPEKLDLSDYAKTADVDAALALKADAADVYTKDEADAKFLTEHQDISNLATKDELSGAVAPLAVQADVDDALALKANAEDVYTKSDVDAALAEKTDVSDYLTLSGVVENILFENESIEEKLIGLAEANLAQDEVIATKADKTYVDGEVYKLTTIVGDLGGAVTYELPSPAGKSFNTLMSNNGTVKLTDDVESGRFGPGITAKNTTKLNLNGHDLTVTGLTTSSSYPAIMSRGTENLSIYGKGTIDAGGGICIEANGVDSVINLTGSTTVYRTNRSGGELIYCYAGTINITNGTFRNDGANTTFLLNCYDANYKADPKKANIIVSSTSKTSGPKFYDFNPADNTVEGEHTNFVAAGCEVVVSTVVEEGVEHTVYTVVKSAE